MRSQVSAFSLVLALVALTTGLSSQAGSQAAANSFSSHVYAWFTDNSVRRLSPGPPSSATSSMPAGPFTQAHVHPDGTSVVFWGGLEGKPRVWLYEFRSRTARSLTRPDVGSLEPSFNWEGRRIVFAADAVNPSSAESLRQTEPWRRSNMNLFVMDADGTNLRQVTNGAFQDSRPAFSPDGTQIVFRSNRDGGDRHLYVVPVDRSMLPRRILAESVVRPWFSADGKFIYFTCVSNACVTRPDQVRIWRIPVEGGVREPITPEGLPNSQGVFVDHGGVHLWFHSTNFDTDSKTLPYRFNLRTREVTMVMPPGFGSAGHVTRSRSGVISFDSTELDPNVR